MITEIVIIQVKDGHSEAFAAGYRQARELLITTPGCLSAKMLWGVESPSRFIGVNEWESKEAHLENFRGDTERYAKYRGLLMEHVSEAEPLIVEHYVDVMDG
ncbi:antibiotic biosynthesis monooxygenase [Streptomyces sp. NPDC006638]|uniref:antibiotic biosynthesis monooxygenase family protein n=1 Tax=Streptomyces sp. NPDC006638 TaxID=3157183 RepID=UPI0033A9169C